MVSSTNNTTISTDSTDYTTNTGPSDICTVISDYTNYIIITDVTVLLPRLTHFDVQGWWYYTW